MEIFMYTMVKNKIDSNSLLNKQVINYKSIFIRTVFNWLDPSDNFKPQPKLRTGVIAQIILDARNNAGVIRVNLHLSGASLSTLIIGWL